MLFPDLAVTRRLELHEAWSSAAHAEMQAVLYPETGAAVEPLGSGCAVYCGKRSPLSGVYGWGLAGPIAAAGLDRAEEFYRTREIPVRVRVCPLVDPSLLRLLGERGYAVEDFMNVYARPIERPGDAPAPVPGLSIRVATEAEARQWFARENAGGDWAEPDGVSFMTIRCTRKMGTRLFLAWSNGEPVGAGALEVHDGVAGLMAASTLPAFQRQGVHTALLHARLAAAIEAGCDLAMVHTRPGAMSQRNVLRAGFPLMYTVVTLASMRLTLEHSFW
jgi:GNAT superfamily N-acetyltransferase